jgi:hypothetical protein
MDIINLRLSQSEINDSDGENLNVRVSAGQSYRFVWKSGQGVLDTIGLAFDSAEQAGNAFTAQRHDFQLTEKSA